jgi:hypothetical protein
MKRTTGNVGFQDTTCPEISLRNLEVKSLHKKQELLHREDRKEREVFKGFS